MAKKTKIGKVKRRAGCLHYVDARGNVMAVPMKRGKKRAKKRGKKKRSKKR